MAIEGREDVSASEIPGPSLGSVETARQSTEGVEAIAAEALPMEGVELGVSRKRANGRNYSRTRKLFYGTIGALLGAAVTLGAVYHDSIFKTPVSTLGLENDREYVWFDLRGSMKRVNASGKPIDGFFGKYAPLENQGMLVEFVRDDPNQPQNYTEKSVTVYRRDETGKVVGTIVDKDFRGTKYVAGQEPITTPGTPDRVTLKGLIEAQLPGYAAMAVQKAINPTMAVVDPNKADPNLVDQNKADPNRSI